MVGGRFEDGLSRDSPGAATLRPPTPGRRSAAARPADRLRGPGPGDGRLAGSAIGFGRSVSGDRSRAIGLPRSVSIGFGPVGCGDLCPGSGYGQRVGRHRSLACIHGHAYDEANRFVDRRGRQRCKACARISESRRQRDYSGRRTAVCSGCLKPSFPLLTSAGSPKSARGRAA
jgi:hypothetical protein